MSGDRLPIVLSVERDEALRRWEIAIGVDDPEKGEQVIATATVPFDYRESAHMLLDHIIGQWEDPTNREVRSA